MTNVPEKSKLKWFTSPVNEINQKSLQRRFILKQTTGGNCSSKRFHRLLKVRGKIHTLIVLWMLKRTLYTFCERNMRRVVLNEAKGYLNTHKRPVVNANVGLLLLCRIQSQKCNMVFKSSPQQFCQWILGFTTHGIWDRGNERKKINLPINYKKYQICIFQSA